MAVCAEVCHIVNRAWLSFRWCAPWLQLAIRLSDTYCAVELLCISCHALLSKVSHHHILAEPQ